MTAMTNTTNPDVLRVLLADIRDWGYHLNDDHRAEFTRITGLVLPSPGDRVSWASPRTGQTRTGTVDDVYGARYGFEARIEEDRTVEFPHKCTYAVDVDSLTYRTGRATVGRVADDAGRLISVGGALK